MKEANLTYPSLSTLSLLIFLALFNGCKESDPEPEPTVTKIDGHAQSFTLSTFASILVDFGMHAKDDSSGLVYLINAGTTNLGYGDNAMVHLSKIDVITDESEFTLEFDDRVLQTKNNLSFEGIIEFYPNHGDDEIHLPNRMYKMTTIKFKFDAESLLSLYTSDDPDEVAYYMEHKEEFIEQMKHLMTVINDSEPHQSGNQPMPFFIVCTPKK
jgi:hypothetical protein